MAALGARPRNVQYNARVLAQPLQDIDARRQKLIQAWRLFPDGNFEKTIEAADADDLAWLVERIDEQLKETPLWLKDPVPLAESMANLRHCRIVVSQMLGHKRTLDNTHILARTEFRANVALVVSDLGLLVAIAALVLGLTLR
jgi:hypothetical protein